MRDDAELHRYAAEQVKRLTGGRDDARKQLQRRLVKLDQQIAQVREHLLSMAAAAAKALGLYDRASDLTTEREQVETTLAEQRPTAPALPGVNELRRRIGAEFESLAQVIDGGSVEESASSSPVTSTR